MIRIRTFTLALLVPLPLLAQSASFGTRASGPPSSTSQPSSTTGQGATAPPPTLAPSVTSPSESVQQFRTQRAAALNAGGVPATTSPGSGVPIAGAGLPAGSVLGAQVVQIVPGTSITVVDLSGVTRTFPLPANYAIPADVTTGSYVALTALNGGYVTVANANGVLPSSTVAGGIGDTAPNLTQVAAANGSLARPNLTTRQVAPQNVITGIGGFYVPGVSTGAPGSVTYPTGSESTVGGTMATGGGTLETAPAGATLAGAGYVAANAPTGIPAAGPLTSISWSGTSLAAAVARAQGTRRLPEAATYAGALATIEGVGRDIVTRTALVSWRVVSWDGATLVVKDDQGRRRRLEIAQGTPVPRDLRPGRLVVLDFRGDDTLRSVRYVL